MIARTARRTASLTVAAALTLTLAGTLSFPTGRASAEEAARRVPDAALAAQESTGQLRTATFAGGCFWGVQGVFQHVRGVKQAVSGYAGGSKDTAQYDQVSTGRTGHTEAVRVTYDPAQIRYDELLQVFFSVALDPTEVDAQGPDEGPQYRSAIFPADDAQAKVARAYIAQLDGSKTFAKPIATKIETGTFYPAEAYHQDFMALNPRHRYIVVNDAPKLRDLKVLFPDRTTDSPVLVGKPKA